MQNFACSISFSGKRVVETELKWPTRKGRELKEIKTVPSRLLNQSRDGVINVRKKRKIVLF